MQINDWLGLPAKARDFLHHCVLPRDAYYTRRLTPTELTDRFTQSVVTVSLYLDMYLHILDCSHLHFQLTDFPAQMNAVCLGCSSEVLSYKTPKVMLSKLGAFKLA